MPDVLDLTRLLPGPLAGRMLVSLGFKVLQLLPPRGDLAESAAPELYQWLQCGKDTETVDLTVTVGQERLKMLVRQARILLDSSLPGAMERMDVGPDDLRAINPKLVYVRVGGYPPPHETLPGHDLTYLAAAGLLDRYPSAWKELQIADICGAFWTAMAALDGLRREGGFYEVHLADAVGSISYPHVPVLDGRTICYGVYDCLQGRITLAALEPALWKRFCEATARLDWIDQSFSRADASNPIHRELIQLFRTRTAADWERWAIEKKIPLRAVRQSLPESAPEPPWSRR